MLELFDFLWKASSAKAPFSPARFYDEYQMMKRLTMMKILTKSFTLTICLKSDISGKVSHLKIQDHCQKSFKLHFSSFLILWLYQGWPCPWPSPTKFLTRQMYTFTKLSLNSLTTLLTYFGDIKVGHVKSLVLADTKSQLAEQFRVLAASISVSMDSW